MATISVPQHAFTGAVLLSGTVLPKSADLTIPVSFLGFEINFEVKGLQPNTTANSAGWEANVYRSTDGGGTYETVPSYSRVIARNPAATDQVSITIPGGQWLLRLTSAGSCTTTWSFLVGTADILTGVLNT